MATQNSWNNRIDDAVITLNSTTNAINISSDASATTVNIATGGAAKACTVGSTTGASSLVLQYGTADFTLASAIGTVISALDTGEITQPLQTAFLCYLPSDDLDKTGDGQSYFMGDHTALTEVFDIGSNFSGNAFTAPVTGRYLLGCTLHFKDLTAAMTATAIWQGKGGLYLSGYVSPGAIRTVTNQCSISIRGIYDMDASDVGGFSTIVSNGAADTADIGGGSPLISFIYGILLS